MIIYYIQLLFYVRPDREKLKLREETNLAVVIEEQPKYLLNKDWEKRLRALS